MTDKTQEPDERFADPAVQEIIEAWRLRQDFHREEKALTLRAKAICRRACDDDKKRAEVAYRAIMKGEGDSSLTMALLPLLEAREVISKSRLTQEKTLKFLAKQLPVYEWTSGVRGFGELGLAAVVGEAGDLSKYRTVSGVWKRCGLAVIDGERQRRKSGDAALAHAYSPSRRAVLWTLADSMLKAQGKDENAGPYRLLYEAEKAKAQADENVATDGHAHSRAMRHMFKRFLLDLTVAWRSIDRGRWPDVTHSSTAPVDHLIAAE